MNKPTLKRHNKDDCLKRDDAIQTRLYDLIGALNVDTDAGQDEWVVSAVKDLMKFKKIKWITPHRNRGVISH